MLGKETFAWPEQHRGIRIKGKVQAHRSTKNLIRQLEPGAIAVIHHDNLDELAAEGLMEAGAAAVVNTGMTMSGAFPTTAPLKLLDAGIPIVETSPDAFDILSAASYASLSDDGIDLGTGWLPCRWFTRHSWHRMNSHALDKELANLSRFIDNTLRYAHLEKEYWLSPFPMESLKLRVGLRGRQALVVARGGGYKSDLRALKSYMKRVKPVLIGVDGGADALLDNGWIPDLIVGDMDSVSDRALGCGAELVVHGYRSGETPGMARVQAAGQGSEARVLCSGGTSEDAALLLAFDGGCSLIVGVGLHAHMQDFLAKGRQGMGSSWLVRMKIGSKLVDARGISGLLGVPPSSRGNYRGIGPSILGRRLANILGGRRKEPIYDPIESYDRSPRLE
ncbi:putative cytokinetic ring protein SteA [Paenibacillus puerhi]|uniref:putative cytokinetic ring protein SteA n=1 Tax=Paenibacillus puerhi TaxID=2692622 RepID=UPI00135979DE|nr:putative cytokinetic ring protein SteA [Paenibacillus puerhi]